MRLLYSSSKAAKDPRLRNPITVSYDSKADRVSWVEELWQHQVVDTDYLYGDCSGDEWLNSMGAYYSRESLPDVPAFSSNPLPPKYTYGAVTLAPAAETIASIQGRCKKSEFSLVFLDSFSVIENSEPARRVHRLIQSSPGQSALIRLFTNKPEAVSRIGPREFETLVAHTLKEIGFSSVQLRRYVKDDGADIIAILANANDRDEVVVVEVKHGKRGITLNVLDRLNGVRSRLRADRALAVTSAHVTRAARVAYEGHEAYIKAYTFRELMAILSDSDDWFRSPHGLWSKKSSDK